jgi:hypothetical protein
MHALLYCIALIIPTRARKCNVVVAALVWLVLVRRQE